MVPKTSIPLRHVGDPLMFALVPISGLPTLSINPATTTDFDCRNAKRPVFPVTFNGTFSDAGTIIVSGPGQK